MREGLSRKLQSASSRHRNETASLGIPTAGRIPQAGLADTKLPGRRIYVAGNYIIAYRVEPDAIKISYIRHGRQRTYSLDKDEGADIPDTD